MIGHAALEVRSGMDAEFATAPEHPWQESVGEYDCTDPQESAGDSTDNPTGMVNPTTELSPNLNLIDELEREQREDDEAALAQHIASIPELAGATLNDALHFKLQTDASGNEIWGSTLDTQKDNETVTLELNLAAILGPDSDLLDEIMALQPGDEPIVKTKAGTNENGDEVLFITTYLRTANSLVVKSGEIIQEQEKEPDREEDAVEQVFEADESEERIEAPVNSTTNLENVGEAPAHTDTHDNQLTEAASATQKETNEHLQTAIETAGPIQAQTDAETDGTESSNEFQNQPDATPETKPVPIQATAVESNSGQVPEAPPIADWSNQGDTALYETVALIEPPAESPADLTPAIVTPALEAAAHPALAIMNTGTIQPVQNNKPGHAETISLKSDQDSRDSAVLIQPQAPQLAPERTEIARTTEVAELSSFEAIIMPFTEHGSAQVALETAETAPTEDLPRYPKASNSSAYPAATPRARPELPSAPPAPDAGGPRLEAPIAQTSQEALPSQSNAGTAERPATQEALGEIIATATINITIEQPAPAHENTASAKTAQTSDIAATSPSRAEQTANEKVAQPASATKEYDAQATHEAVPVNSEQIITQPVTTIESSKANQAVETVSSTTGRAKTPAEVDMSARAAENAPSVQNEASNIQSVQSSKTHIAEISAPESTNHSDIAQTKAAKVNETTSTQDTETISSSAQPTSNHEVAPATLDTIDSWLADFGGINEEISPSQSNLTAEVVADRTAAHSANRAEHAFANPISSTYTQAQSDDDGAIVIEVNAGAHRTAKRRTKAASTTQVAA